MLWRFWTLSHASFQALAGGAGTWMGHVVNIAIRPGFTMLTFGYLISTVADGAALRDAVFGAAILTLNWPTLGGSIQTVGYELGNGTLGMTLASPGSRTRLLASRGVVHIPMGALCFVSAATLGTLVFDLHIEGANWAGVAISVALVACSLTALGLLLGVGSLVLREVWALLGLASVALYTLSGAIVPRSNLGPFPRAVGDGLPSRWGIEAMQRALHGDSFAALAPYFAAEAVVGVAVFALGIASLRLYELRASRRGSADLV